MLTLDAILDNTLVKYNYKGNIATINFKYKKIVNKTINDDLFEYQILIINITELNKKIIDFINKNISKILILIVEKKFPFNELIHQINAFSIDAISWNDDNYLIIIAND